MQRAHQQKLRQRQRQRDRETERQRDRETKLHKSSATVSLFNSHPPSQTISSTDGSGRVSNESSSLAHSHPLSQEPSRDARRGPERPRPHQHSKRRTIMWTRSRRLELVWQWFPKLKNDILGKTILGALGPMDLGLMWALVDA